jgi:glycosyltransferase involved in cell wall biosynthesis
MTNRSSEDLLHVVIAMPVFRDWEVASLLCQRIDQQIAQLDHVDVRILLVDDGSPEPLSGWTPFDPTHIRRIDVLQLRRNMGHQRAIAMGLCLIQSDIECDAILVMDADGEDRAEDVVRLIDRFRESSGSIVFATRQRRFASVAFRIGYWSYRVLHRILTGVAVREGNFSIIPRSAVSRLVVMSELWNHYAGAIHQSKLPFDRLPVDRGRRLAGKSHMDLVALVVHGLSGISTFYDVVATRILIASIACMLLLAVALAAVVGIRLGTHLAIPGWATLTGGLGLLLMLQFVSMSFSLVFLMINTRQNMTIVPTRDYRVYVDSVRALWSGASQSVEPPGTASS